MNYGYECKDWTYEEMGKLAEEVAEIWPDVEIDGLYPGVRVRRLPKDDAKVKEITQAFDHIYDKHKTTRKYSSL